MKISPEIAIQLSKDCGYSDISILEVTRDALRNANHRELAEAVDRLMICTQESRIKWPCIYGHNDYMDNCPSCEANIPF